MASNRTLIGCWTCRLRKKRCPGGSPACRSCAALEIQCFRGVAKPAWMDSGAKQKEMARRVKEQVRDGAQGRRVRQSMPAAGPDGGRPAFVVMLQQTVAAEMAEMTKTGGTAGTAGTAQSTNSTLRPGYSGDAPLPLPSAIRSGDQDTADEPPLTVFDLGDINMNMNNSTGPEEEPTLECSAATTTTPPVASLTSPGLVWELDFSMMYLDHVFPFLFPFYRPPLAGTGRAWLFTFLRQSPVVFRSVLSLSAYFFSVHLRDIYGDHTTCKRSVWALIVQQADLSLGQMQDDLAAATRSGRRISLRKKAQFMETILQLLVFELVVSRTADWRTHLVPALVLFEEIIEEAESESGEAAKKEEKKEKEEKEEKERLFPKEPNLVASLQATPGLVPVLACMNWVRSPMRGLERPVWNPEQAAFRFFAAQLLVMDIVASTALAQKPRLQCLHGRLLADVPRSEIAGPLDLAAFFGCRNAVLVSIGEIAALDSGRRAGTAAHLDVLEAEARRIQQVLDAGLSQAAAPPDAHEPHYFARPWLHDNSSNDNNINRSSSNSTVAAGNRATQIWAHAARIYLSVALHRRPASDPGIVRDVATVLILLQAVDSPAELHTFAWPMCIARCMTVEPVRQSAFRKLILEQGHMRLLSGIREAGLIMEAVWEESVSGTEEPLDVAACLCILGKPAMLV